MTDALSLVEFLRLFDETHAESWRGWRSIAAAMEGLEPEDPAFVERVTRRTDSTRAKKVYGICGRGAGKSRFGALVASAFATRTYKRVVGENIYVGIFAPDRRQATVSFNYVEGLLSSKPETRSLIVGEPTQSSITLANGVIVEVLTANYKAVRSRAYALAIVEEAAFLPTDESATPDTELLRALRPALARVPGSLLLVLSSPYARKGELYKAHREHFGKAGSDTLVIQAPTLELNPTFDAEEIRQAYAEDPASAAAEYGAEFRTDVETLFTVETIRAVTPAGVFEVSPDTSNLSNVRAFVDPSGGSSDSFTLGVAATVKGVETLLCVREWKPPFSPEAVVSECASTLRTYRVRSVAGDAYSGEFVRELFRKAGIEYKPSPLNRSGIYLDGLALINSRRCRLLDVPRLHTQLITLERRTGRNQDSIDHQRGGHDDVANAAIGALVVNRSAGNGFRCWTPNVHAGMSDHVREIAKQPEPLADYEQALREVSEEGVAK